MSAGPAVPTLSRGGLDRAALRRDDETWLETAWQRGWLLRVDEQGRTSVDEAGPRPALVLERAVAAPDVDGPRLLLGADDEGAGFWAVGGTPSRSLDSRPLGLRDVGATLSGRDATLLVTAVALANWHRTHPRCPRCGNPTRVVQAGWARHCDVDDSRHFPRTDPAVIVLLHDDGDRVLLGRQPTWPAGRYSTIAGFVEAGESAEQAVRREVHEETGTTVDEVRYRGSQPWPFPQSLMLGYEAVVTGGTPSTVDDELEDVRWFTRDDLLGGVITMPPPTSIARWLIEGWLGEPIRD